MDGGVLHSAGGQRDRRGWLGARPPLYSLPYAPAASAARMGTGLGHIGDEFYFGCFRGRARHPGYSSFYAGNRDRLPRRRFPAGPSFRLSYGPVRCPPQVLSADFADSVVPRARRGVPREQPGDGGTHCALFRGLSVRDRAGMAAHCRLLLFHRFVRGEESSFRTGRIYLWAVGQIGSNVFVYTAGRRSLRRPGAERRTDLPASDDPNGAANDIFSARRLRADFLRHRQRADRRLLLRRAKRRLSRDIPVAGSTRAARDRAPCNRFGLAEALSYDRDRSRAVDVGGILSHRAEGNLRLVGYSAAC